MGHSTGGLGAPNDLELMKLYADSYEKILVDNQAEFLAMAQEKAAAAM